MVQGGALPGVRGAQPRIPIPLRSPASPCSAVTGSGGRRTERREKVLAGTS